jgi:pyroglutamyl-peptidase
MLMMAKEVDLRISEDPGRYLCDFIYYSSLAHLWKQGQEKRVVFLHVPGDSDEEAIVRGCDVLIELIKVLVQSQGKLKPDAESRVQKVVTSQ